MGGLLSYSGLTTKIKAMKSNLISSSEYIEIANLSTVTEYVNYLQKKPSYAKLLGNVDPTTLHRGDIEKLLIRSVYLDYAKIYRFANVKQRKFLDIYFIGYEVSNLKRCLRMIFDHRDVELDLSLFQEFFKQHSDIDIVALSECKTISDFVNSLKSTMYYDPLIKLDSIKNPTLFDYEMALDLFYFSKIWDLKNKCLKGKEKKLVTHTFGSKIDMLNIQWIYRSKKYYHLTPAAIYALIIPIRYKLKQKDIAAMVESDKINDLIAVIKSTYYGEHYNQLDNESLEALYKTIIDKIYYNAIKKYPYSVASMNTYLYLKEREMHKLITAVECIRYGFDPNETAQIIT